MTLVQPHTNDVSGGLVLGHLPQRLRGWADVGWGAVISTHLFTRHLQNVLPTGQARYAQSEKAEPQGCSGCRSSFLSWTLFFLL